MRSADAPLPKSMLSAGMVALVLVACTVESAPSLGRCRAKPSDQSDIPVSMASKGGLTYYVRSDGGNAEQCTGRTDAPYAGSGVGKPCAWNSLEVALPGTGETRIRGGDTLRIAAGTYAIGRVLQAIPSGPSPASPTRVLGHEGAVPKLVGTRGVHRVLNLDGSSNVEVGHLEITDGSDCVFRHPAAEASCVDGAPWARVGLYARASTNVWLHDLNIHGMAARGINAGALRNWTVERLKLNRNGTAGWDGNVGPNGSNSGRMILRNVEIGWNGCGERSATGEPWACWAQQTGGYGDGFGTTETGGQWLIEDAHVHHNTSDGLDLRYLDGADTTVATLRRVRAVANAGNQVKIRGNSQVEDSVLVGHCSYFRGKFQMTEKDLCRSDGSTLQLVMTGNDSVVVRNSTLAGEGAAQIGHSEGDQTDRIEIRQNVVVGFSSGQTKSGRSAFTAGKSRAVIHYTGNLAWQTAGCPPGAVCDRDPKLTGMSLEAFNAMPRVDSPVLGSAGAAPCKD